MTAPRFKSAAADRSAAKAPPPPAFAPHPDAPFPGNGFRLSGRDGASFYSVLTPRAPDGAGCSPGLRSEARPAAVSTIAVAPVGASDGSTDAEGTALSTSAPASAAPLSRLSPDGEGGAVILSEASRFILHLVALHDGTTESDVLARLIAARAKEIGLSPLLGRHFEDSS